MGTPVPSRAGLRAARRDVVPGGSEGAVQHGGTDHPARGVPRRRLPGVPHRRGGRALAAHLAHPGRPASPHPAHRRGGPRRPHPRTVADLGPATGGRGPAIPGAGRHAAVATAHRLTPGGAPGPGRPPYPRHPDRLPARRAGRPGHATRRPVLRLVHQPRLRRLALRPARLRPLGPPRRPPAVLAGARHRRPRRGTPAHQRRPDRADRLLLRRLDRRRLPGPPPRARREGGVHLTGPDGPAGRRQGGRGHAGPVVAARPVAPRRYLSYGIGQSSLFLFFTFAGATEMDARFADMYAKTTAGLVCPGHRPPAAPHTLGSYVNQVSYGKSATLDVRPRLRQLSTPALVVKGGCDYLPWSFATEYRNTIPGARLVYFPDAGHQLFDEQPDRYRAVVAAFLDDRPLPVAPY